MPAESGAAAPDAVIAVQDPQRRGGRPLGGQGSQRAIMQLPTYAGAPGAGVHLEGSDLCAVRWRVVVTTWPEHHETDRFPCVLGKKHPGSVK